MPERWPYQFLWWFGLAGGLMSGFGLPFVLAANLPVVWIIWGGAVICTIVILVVLTVIRLHLDR